MQKKYDVLVIGELNVDLILNQIDSFPEIGKEKFAREMNLVMGSSSAIFACNLASLGKRVGFVGKIGKDNFGDMVISSLEKKGVDTSLIFTGLKDITGATIVLNFDQDRAMITYPGAMEKLTLKDIPIEAIHSTKHLHISSYFLQPGIRPHIDEIFKQAKKAGVTTSIDIQWDPQEKWDFNYKQILPQTDIFLPNEVELLKLTRESDLQSAIEKIKKYCNILVVKSGERGSFLWKEKNFIHQKAYLNNSVVDTIGAGDSFNAGFIFQFLNKATLSECQDFANLMGAVSTTAPGGTAAFKDYDTIMKIARVTFSYGKKKKSAR